MYIKIHFGHLSDQLYISYKYCRMKSKEETLSCLDLWDSLLSNVQPGLGTRKQLSSPRVSCAPRWGKELAQGAPLVSGNISSHTLGGSHSKPILH